MEHEEICCEIYLNEIIKKPAYPEDIVKRCITLAKSKGLPHPEGSIKMKFQNIKSLCDNKGIEHTSPFSPLAHNSYQNGKAFVKVITAAIR